MRRFSIATVVILSWGCRASELAPEPPQDLSGSWIGKWKSSRYAGAGGPLEIDVRKTESGRLRVVFKLTNADLPGGAAVCEATSQGRIVTLSANQIQVGAQTVEAHCVFFVTRDGSHAAGRFHLNYGQVCDTGNFDMELVKG